ncbi:MAG TPA: hypothetical protein VIM16_11800 [Mucilaginibacter sp.]|jgi:hypothetical protein
MFIEVIEWCHNNISRLSKEPSFYLERDDWNDFHFYTSYHLHVTGKHTADKQNTMIGLVKILKQGQEEKQKYLIPLGGLEALDDIFCSLGQSLDYYERIAPQARECRSGQKRWSSRAPPTGDKLC